MSGETMGIEDAFTDRLSEYLDDEEMSASDRMAIEAHLAGCASCRSTLAELRAVTAHATSLPDAPPSTDLWPGIAARLDAPSTVRAFVSATPARRFSFTMPQLVAAGLALMVLSGGMVWVSRLGDPRTNLPPLAAQVEEPQVVPANFADSHYDQAISDLEKTLEEGRNRLDPETVRILEQNLNAIDVAIAQARKALRADPENIYLNNHFAESRQRKLSLLRRASALATATETGGS
jgi:tetratricopeptide (TPR) repeat protein